MLTNRQVPFGRIGSESKSLFDANARAQYCAWLKVAQLDIMSRTHLGQADCHNGVDLRIDSRYTEPQEFHQDRRAGDEPTYDVRT